MRERYIAPAIMLIAGAIISILNIIDEVPVSDGLIRLLAVLIIFYILGKIVTVIIRKTTAQKIADEKIEVDKAGENIAAEEEVITKDQ